MSGRLSVVSTSRACPDCPATHTQVFEELLPHPQQPCAFRVATVGERETLPHAWFGTYAFGLVRRGILVRQRIDGTGGATAVDVVGPGGAILLDGNEASVSGYAAAEAMVCLCPASVLAQAATNPTPATRDLLRLHTIALERMDRLANARNQATAVARVAALLTSLSEVLSPPRKLEVIP